MVLYSGQLFLVAPGLAFAPALPRFWLVGWIFKYPKPHRVLPCLITRNLYQIGNGWSVLTALAEEVIFPVPSSGWIIQTGHY